MFRSLTVLDYVKRISLNEVSGLRIGGTRRSVYIGVLCSSFKDVSSRRSLLLQLIILHIIARAKWWNFH